MITVRNIGLKKSTSKAELRRYLRVRGLGDTTHLGDPPAVYPKGAHEGDRVEIKANLCCTSEWPMGDCEGYVKFIRDGEETRIPSTYFKIPNKACRWSPTYSFTMSNHDEIITIEPWEHDPANPDDKGDSVDIFIEYIPPGEPVPGRDPLDSLIIWFESKRPKCPIGLLEGFFSGAANFIIRVTPEIPILPGS